MQEEFDYIIAKKWDSHLPMVGDNICAYYSGGTSIFYGTKEMAKGFLEYVCREDTDGGKGYSVYKVSLEKLEV